MSVTSRLTATGAAVGLLSGLAGYAGLVSVNTAGFVVIGFSIAVFVLGVIVLRVNARRAAVAVEQVVGKAPLRELSRRRARTTTLDDDEGFGPSTAPARVMDIGATCRNGYMTTIDGDPY